MWALDDRRDEGECSEDFGGGEGVWALFGEGHVVFVEGVQAVVGGLFAEELEGFGEVFGLDFGSWGVVGIEECLDEPCAVEGAFDVDLGVVVDEEAKMAEVGGEELGDHLFLFGFWER